MIIDNSKQNYVNLLKERLFCDLYFTGHIFSLKHDFPGQQLISINKYYTTLVWLFVNDKLVKCFDFNSIPVKS